MSSEFETTAFASFEQKWLDANPEQAMVALFLDPDTRLRTSAFGCLVYELEQAALGLREPQVAIAKLAWWRQELGTASTGSPRHPVSAMLFSDFRVATVGIGAWAALVDGALAMQMPSSPANLGAQFVDYAKFYTPVVRLECALLDSDTSHADALATMLIASRLLADLRRIADTSERLPVPLDLLARHGMTRANLGAHGPKRTALVRDYLGLLDAQLSGAFAHAQVSLARRVRARLDLAAIRRAARTDDPIEWLIAHALAGRWTSLWVAWNEARHIARINRAASRD